MYKIIPNPDKTKYDEITKLIYGESKNNEEWIK